MNELLRQLLIICPFIFLAGFVDSIAGGGGVISLPTYLFAGLPAHLAAGTNKFAMCLGTTMASVNYLRAGKVHLQVALYSVIGAFIGSAIGARTALYVNELMLKNLMLVVLPLVAIFMLLKDRIFDKRRLKEQELTDPIPLSPKKIAVLSLLIGLVIGVYDGLIGPGTGTFLILAYSWFMGLDLVTGSGCAKMCNLASNVAALIVYLIGGKVVFAIGIPAAICAILGNFAGSKLAIKGGAKYIRIVMILVFVLLFVKFLIPS